MFFTSFLLYKILLDIISFVLSIVIEKYFLLYQTLKVFIIILFLSLNSELSYFRSFINKNMRKLAANNEEMARVNRK